MDERVLIPRSETEILVEKACEYIMSRSPSQMSIAEVGVGTGAIGLSLLQEINDKELSYLGVDISKDALDVFEINHFRHEFKISNKHIVAWQLGDRLEGVEAKFDMILSNPPYIKEKEDLNLVHGQVKSFEPHVALFLADESYDEWFTKFFIQSASLLKEEGLFLMEGHENHLSHLLELAEDIYKKPGEIIKDYNEKDRFLIIRK